MCKKESRGVIVRFRCGLIFKPHFILQHAYFLKQPLRSPCFHPQTIFFYRFFCANLPNFKIVRFLAIQKSWRKRKWVNTLVNNNALITEESLKFIKIEIFIIIDRRCLLHSNSTRFSGFLKNFLLKTSCVFLTSWVFFVFSGFSQLCAIWYFFCVCLKTILVMLS